MVWYEDEVKRLEAERLNYKYTPETLFYGSSSIRMWDTLYTDFANYKPVNLGFGGSTLAACVWYFDRILLPLIPKRIIFYAGDNDIGDGRHPEEIFIFFQQLISRVTATYPGVPFAYISIKPSIARWNLNESIKYANKLIANELKKHPDTQYIDVYSQMINTAGKPKPELFLQDGLHMSTKGYDIWKPLILKYLESLPAS